MQITELRFAHYTQTDDVNTGKLLIPPWLEAGVCHEHPLLPMCHPLAVKLFS